ncbi:MAG: tetratricopeptide repeat protein [Bacteroidetes bacterium]|nr:tetratricopeptide repeat protein [Bacteroidota bacterium]
MDISQGIQKLAEKIICKECGASNLPSDINCGLCGADLNTEQETAFSHQETTSHPEKNGSVSKLNFSVWATIAGFLTVGFLLSFMAISEYDTGTKSELPTENGETQLSAKPNVVLPESLESWIGTQEKKLKSSTNEVIKTLSLSVADSLIKYESFERAGNWVEKVFNLDTTQVSIALKIANLYYDANRMEIAIPFYKIFLRHNPENTDARVDMATAIISTSASPMEAVTELKKVLSINQNHQIANLNLGVLYFRVNKYEQAELYLTQAKTINPENKAGQSASEMLEQIRIMKSKN